MPGNARPRRRKHRGTQTGSIDRRGRTGRPRSRQEAMAQARQRRSGGGKAKPVDRSLQEPTWRGAIIRGVIFAALLLPISLLFGQPVAGAIVLSVIAAFFYVPLGFVTERFFWRRKMARYQAEQAEKKASRGRPQE
jgi:hypothetical protein